VYVGKEFLPGVEILGLLLIFVFIANLSALAKESVVYSLAPNDSGIQPNASLVADEAGNLYGTTSNQGFWGYGAVFELTPHSHGTWTETTLYAFTGGSDGGTPMANLILDKSGNLYGTTESGGGGPCNTFIPPGCGVVFRLSPSSGGNWTETVLHTFAGCRDGVYPLAGLVLDAQDNLYGTTSAGGNGCNGGDGIVFKLSSVNGVWRETVLHRFQGRPTDGSQLYSGLTLDAAGNLYGTTSQGGTYGCGTVFRLTKSATGWTESLLHIFACGTDGNFPVAGVTFDCAGNLYGTTEFGGIENQDGYGTVFKLSRSGGTWNEAVLHRFSNGRDGAEPAGQVIFDSHGGLLSTTYAGGRYASGSVFALISSNESWTETVLYSFTGGTDGAYPLAGAIIGPSGHLYGTTFGGGYGRGLQGDDVVFEVGP
jgi:uncharacterized repeat protein (TIGR03803 family)